MLNNIRMRSLSLVDYCNEWYFVGRKKRATFHRRSIALNFLTCEYIFCRNWVMEAFRYLSFNKKLFYYMTKSLVFLQQLFINK